MAEPQADFHCLDFRRAKLADPARLALDARAHLAACRSCQAFARQVDADERRIADALAVTVPDGLAERVLLRNRTLRQGPAWRLIAVAATVVFSIGLGLATWLPAGHQHFAQFAIEHVLHEPDALSSRRLADAREFGAVLTRFGGEMLAPVGTVRYMKLCPVPGGTGWHIVLDTEHGTATLLLIPGRGRAAGSVAAQLRSLAATARRAGAGWYAVVTDSARSRDAIDAMLQRRVSWRI
ncbi:MAG: DUF3379 family protein [Rhodocyclaceae bacterium]|nr:DUF3379 family protein [Rhodocyclaceae bacterium]